MTTEERMTDLQSLQAMRRNYKAGTMEWWAMSLAIDALVGVSTKTIAEDIARIQRARVYPHYSEEALCNTQK